MKLKSMVVVFLVLFFGTAAYAGTCEKAGKWLDEKIASDSYLERTSGMLLEGLNRVLKSPISAYQETYNGVKESDNPIYGTIEGVMRGAFKAAEEIVKGAVDFGLAIIPEYRGVDASENQES